MLRLFNLRTRTAISGRVSFHVSRRLEKTVPFLLADIGEGITEVEVLQWYVGEGQIVRQFDKIAEVQSDKATVEITSRYDGVIKKLHYEKGSTAIVGKPLVDIETDDSTPNAQGESAVDSKKEDTKMVNSTSLTVEELKGPIHGEGNDSNNGLVKAMPGVRHFARVNGVDIRKVKGTGEKGQVVKEDVKKYLKLMKTKHYNDSIITTTKSIKNIGEHSVVPLNAFQKAMVKSMQAALKIPHFGFHDEIDVHVLAELRKGLIVAVEERHGVKLTMMAFFIKALSMALSEYPLLNSHLDPETHTLKHYISHNVGVAVDTDHGLAVPVISAIQDRSVVDIARELSRLSDAARSNKLSPSDLSNGTFTISNIGSIGGITASPVIVSPQVCIVAMGRTRTLPRFNSAGQIQGRLVLPVSFSADHRVVDGATVARFSRRWRELLEDPSKLLLHL